MSANHNEYLDLCAGYALGSLDAPDRDRLEKHLAEGCDECLAALADFKTASAMIGLSAEPVEPPAGVRERVLAAIPPKAPEQRPTVVDFTPPVRRWATWGLAAAAAILLVINLATWRRAERYRHERDALVGQLTTLQDQLDDASRWLAVATNPQNQYAVLRPTPAGDQNLVGWATLEPTTGDAIVVLRNATPPTARDYELWAIQGGTPVSLGVVDTDANGLAILQLESIPDSGNIQALALSLEPAGGSPQSTPTGPVVMLGTVGS